MMDKQLKVLVDRLEVERQMMELWCWKRGISYIEPFIAYQQNLIDFKNKNSRHQLPAEKRQEYAQ